MVVFDFSSSFSSDWISLFSWLFLKEKAEWVVPTSFHFPEETNNLPFFCIPFFHHRRDDGEYQNENHKVFIPCDRTLIGRNFNAEKTSPIYFFDVIFPYNYFSPWGPLCHSPCLINSCLCDCCWKKDHG